MKFSIVIPVYNVEAYLPKCLNSVLSQTYDDYEVICIDDGSADNSLNILKSYQKNSDKIKIFSQENKGLSNARNKGIKEAQGDYIFFLDSDDWITESALKILSLKEMDEDLICFSGGLFYEKSKQRIIDKPLPEKTMKGWDYYNEYALKSRKFHFVCTVLRLYKKDFLLRNNLTFKEGIYHEDNLFTPIVCYYAEKVKLISDCLYIYRIREGSITQSTDITKNEKKKLDIIKVANELSDFFIPKVGIDKSALYKEIAGEYFKGFMSHEMFRYENNDNVFKKKINWKNFKTVAVYPRHKRIYRLLKISPVLFRIYISYEKKIKTYV